MRTRWDTVARFTGSDLVGPTYRRPLDWVPFPDDTVHEIVVGEDFVSPEDGTGIVHMAPAFGADDYATGRRYNLAFLQPGRRARPLRRRLPLVARLWVKDADPVIIDELKRRGSARGGHGKPNARVPALLALRHAAHLLRARSWFVKHHGVQDEMVARNAASTGTRQRSGPVVSARGLQPTWIGRCRAIVTGGRRFRSGCAAPTRLTWRPSAATPNWPTEPPVSEA